MRDGIGVFDSGVGGISVLKKLLQTLPREKYFYYGDERHMPYGEKSPEDIVKYTSEGFRYFDKKNVKIGVVACNTSSTYALDYLKEHFDFPIFGMIDAGVEGVLNVCEKKVAIFATSGTINSKAYEIAIKARDKNLEVINVACVGLASAVQNQDMDEAKALIRKYLMTIPKDTDTLVLGCTHYPLVEDVFKEESLKLQLNLNLVDPAVVLTKKISTYLLENNLLSNEGGVQFYSTEDVNALMRKAAEFLS